MKGEDVDIVSVLGEDYKDIPGMGCWGYESKAKGIELRISGFPDVLDDHVVTSITTVDPEHSIYNIHVGDNVIEAMKILEEKGFKIDKERKNSVSYKFRQLGIHIQYRDEIIKEIAIYLMSTNKDKVQF